MRAPGWGSVAVVLFDKNSKKPIDEIVAHFCIEKCDDQNKPQTAPTSLKGIDIINTAAEVSSLPSASLYFLEFGESIQGIFCNNSAALDVSEADLNCSSWSTEKTAEGLKNKIKILADNMKAFSDEDELRNICPQISSLLFPKAQDDAYKQFMIFLSNNINEENKRVEKPSIFFRAVTSGGELAPFLPLALACFQYDEGKEAFLGDYFRIVSPLPVQSYGKEKACISRKIALLPPEKYDKDLDNAIKGMMPSFTNVTGLEIYNNFSTFNEYLGDSTRTEVPTALFILSHHGNNFIYFNDVAKESLSSDQVRNNFGEPSFAILNACGTGEPYSSEFIYKMNSMGIEAVIATSSKIDAFMAGKFFNCIDEQLGNTITDYRISSLFEKAKECLKKKPNEGKSNLYKRNAYKYILLGNGDLKLCPK